jgi:hypothetical protein
MLCCCITSPMFLYLAFFCFHTNPFYDYLSLFGIVFPLFHIHFINIHTTFTFYFWCLQRSVILLSLSIYTSMFLDILSWLFPLTNCSYRKKNLINFNLLSTMSCAFVHTFSNSYEKWDIYNLFNTPHLCAFLQFWTYDGDPLSAQCHKSTMIPLHDPKDSSSSLFKSSPSLDVHYDGVFVLSSSCSNVLSFCSTSAS